MNSKYQQSRLPGLSAPTRQELHHEHRHRSRRYPARGTDKCKRRGSGSKEDRGRLRLLDLPLERLRHVFRAVCKLRGPRALHGGRSDRRPVVQSSHGSDRNRLPSRLELYLRTDVPGHQFAPLHQDLFRGPGHLRARCRVSHSRDPRIRKHDRDRRNAGAQRFSFRFLHACRLPWAARHPRTDLARRDDGPGGGDGIRSCGTAPLALLLSVLACARHRVGRAIHRRLSNGSQSMTEARYDRAPGDRPSREMQASAPSEFLVYTIGLFVAVLLTATSFWAANTTLLWPGGVFLGLAVLAIAQMGIHLVFFLHVTTGPESTNSVLALAFGVLIVFVVVAGSMWTMADMNASMLMPSAEPMNMRMQH